MRRSRLIRPAYLIYFLIALLLITSIHQLFIKKGLKETIGIFEDTPDNLRGLLQEEFPNRNIKVLKDSHLLDFLNGNSMTLIYEMEAHELMEAKKSYYFYPLYREIVAIGLNRDYGARSIQGYEDLLDLKENIEFPQTTLQLKYILSNISYSLGGRLDLGEAIAYLKKLGEEDKSLGDGSQGRIRIDFLSSLKAKDYKIIVPKEGGLSFQVGILSHEPIDEGIIRGLEDQGQEINFSNQEYIGSQGISPMSDLKDEFRKLPPYNSSFRRKILGEKLYGPADSEEHQTASLVVIGLIILWIIQVERRVIHPGIKKGLFLMGYLLIGLIILGVFKYALFEYNLLAHISWYLYYVFLLPLPVISLYIAENADRIEKKSLSLGIKISITLLLIFIILVLTNDYHQLVFRFLTDDFERIGDEYAYGLAFVLLSVWYGLSQVFAFILMFKKGLDSPGKKRIIFPLIIIIIYVIYILMYNNRVKIIHDMPLVLGVSILNISYWSSAILSDLIPSNRAYYNLFKASNLKMQIIDSNGEISYSSFKDRPISEGIINYFKSTDIDSRGQILVANDLIWSSPISGGRVVTQESIEEINKLRKALEEATAELKRENLVLEKKEKVEKRLILINEQNNLNKEVHQGIKDKLGEIQDLIGEIEEDSLNKKKKLQQIQIIAVYCKRKSELLIKSKSKEYMDKQELSRIVQELSEMTSKSYMSFCRLDGSISYIEALEIYEYHHNIIYLLYKNLVKEATIRIYREEDNIVINTILEGNIEGFYGELKAKIPSRANLGFRIKEFEDATSISIEIQGGYKYDRTI